MNRLAAVIITLFVVLFLAYGLYDFYQNYEYKEKTIHTGFKGEARRNPYYATRLFLKRMGIPTETQTSLQGMNRFPDTDTVLIITTRRTTLSPKRTHELLDWVKSGGHLIALATHRWQYSGSEKDNDEIDYERETDDSGKVSPDPLQRYMGVYTDSRSLFNLEEIDIEEDDAEDKKVYALKLKDVEKKLKLDDNWFHPLYVDSKHKKQTEEVKLHDKNFLLRQKIGDGMITLLASMSFIRNSEIETEDHAEILWQLVHGLHKPLNQPAAIWLVHNDEMPPLWDILWRHYWAFIISLGLLLLFWLIKKSQRFGPLIPKVEENRRSLIEHISNSGNFYWKNNKQQLLLDSTRKALLQRLARVYPGWTQRTEEEQIALLAQQLSLQATDIHKLLYAQGIQQPDEFTQLIRQLEQIRKNI